MKEALQCSKRFYVILQLSYGPGSKLKSDAKPGSHLATCGENTSSLGVGSDASPADVVNAARKRNKGKYCTTCDTISTERNFKCFGVAHSG